MHNNLIDSFRPEITGRHDNADENYFARKKELMLKVGMAHRIT
jgi:hypothetical protein